MDTIFSGLVRATKLDATVSSNQTLQISFVSNASSGQRRHRVERLWERTKTLGHGGFATVFLERCVSEHAYGHVRAVKRIRKELQTATASAAAASIATAPGRPSQLSIDYRRELEAAAFFSHEQYHDYFVRSFGWFETMDSVYITMEYLPLGDLRPFLKSSIPEPEACRITHQLLEGLEFMHENNFAHRDLKPANILVQHPGPAWWVKISDFGISKRVTDTMLHTQVGTEPYLAPEVKGIYASDTGSDDQEGFSLSVDMWSVGVIAYQMVTGKLPFTGSRELFGYIVRGSSFPVPSTSSITPNCTHFMMKAMAANPDQRPTPQVALFDVWLRMQEEIPSSPNPASLSMSSPVSHGDTARLQAYEAGSAIWTTASASQVVLLGKQSQQSNALAVEAAQSPALADPVVRQLQEVSLSNQERQEQNVTTTDNIDSEPPVQFHETQRPLLTGLGNKVAISPHGDRLVLDSQGGLSLWKLYGGRGFRETQQLIKSHYGHTLLSFSPNGQFLASGGPQGQINIWVNDKDGRMKPYQTHCQQSVGRSIHEMIFSLDSNRLISVSDDGLVVTWDLSSQYAMPLSRQSITLGRGIKLENGGGYSVGAGYSKIRLSPDEQWLILYDNSYAHLDATKLELWGSTEKDATEGSDYSRYHRVDVSYKSSRMNALAFSPNGRWLAGIADDKVLCIWGVQKGGLRLTRRDATRKVELDEGRGDKYWALTLIVFSRDSKMLATFVRIFGGITESVATVDIWELETDGQKLRWIQEFTIKDFLSMTSFAFLSIGHTLVVSFTTFAGKHEVIVWERDHLEPPEAPQTT